MERERRKEGARQEPRGRRRRKGRREGCHGWRRSGSREDSRRGTHPLRGGGEASGPEEEQMEGRVGNKGHGRGKRQGAVMEEIQCAAITAAWPARRRGDETADPIDCCDRSGGGVVCVVLASKAAAPLVPQRHLIFVCKNAGEASDAARAARGSGGMGRRRGGWRRRRRRGATDQAFRAVGGNMRLLSLHEA